MIPGIIASSGASSGPISFADAVMADSPWAWWKLDENSGASAAADSSGNGRNLSSLSVPIADRQQPPLIDDGGSSMLFDASNNATGTLTAFSGHVALSFAAILERNSGDAYLLHNGNYGVSSGQGQFLAVLADGALRFQAVASGATRTITTSAGVVPLDVISIVGWSHDPVADTLDFYCNGALVQSVSYTFGLGAGASGQFSIGMIAGASAFTANSFIDHALVFDQALPVARWLAHAQAAGLA